MFELSITIRVRYGETDKMGIANNANYLSWFEIGRTDFCRYLGKTYLEWEKEGIYLPVVEVRCRYKNPALYDDEIKIYTSISDIRKYSLSFSYRLLKDDDSILVAQGWTKHGITDDRGKLIRGTNPFLEWVRDRTLNKSQGKW